jgi:hypothetical protein
LSVAALSSNLKNIDEGPNAKANLVYPNPTDGKVIIEFQNRKKRKLVKLMDATGKNVIKTKTTNKSILELNMSNLSAGVYLIQTQIKDKKEVHKIIKQ